ncbi:MAG: MFS transporter [Alphaproteobacteria bacterium]|nr:MFS transporter [Alphaproteobacteria bacterium]
MDAAATPCADHHSLRRDFKVVGLVSTAHMVSHFYFLLLPPLIPLIKGDLGVSYEAIGYAITMLNLVSLATQTPVGFLIDRLGARPLLIAGLMLGSFAVVVMAFSPSYWVLLAMMGVIGLANCVYHPADYSILSSSVASHRMGRAFGAHNLMGYVGFAIAPPALLLAAGLWGWRGALICAGSIGLAISLLIWHQADILQYGSAKTAKTDQSTPAPSGASVLTLTPILLALLFYVCSSVGTTGIMAFSVISLQALHGTSIQAGTAALSGFLGAAAAGVAFGGFLADRTRHHDRIAACGLISTATMLLLVSNFNLGETLQIIVMTCAGFLHGGINPSRDMLVRAITPPGQSGKVFGFVTTGSNIGAIVAPPILGRILDHGDPQWVLWVAASFLLLAALARPRRRMATDA